MSSKNIVIVDYQLGNILSIKQACEIVGLNANLSNDREDIMNADGVILPGVGAFGKAMINLKQLNLDVILQEYIASGKPLLGICLGMQLLFEESTEFGLHKGLGFISGDVRTLANESVGIGNKIKSKIPQIGWNRISPVSNTGDDDFIVSMFNGINEDRYMYFVHSFYVRPDDVSIIVANTNYNGITYCSMLKINNIIACQFHPEKSAENGLELFRNIAKWISGSVGDNNNLYSQYNKG